MRARFRREMPLTSQTGRNGPQQLTGEKARQAVPLGHMRYVLIVSMALVVVAFALVDLGVFG
jgi:hypothetical protein